MFARLINPVRLYIVNIDSVCDKFTLIVLRYVVRVGCGRAAGDGDLQQH